MDVLTELKVKVDEFSKKLIHNPLAQESPLELKISEIRKDSDWSKWSKDVGIYAFFDDDKIHYIGRALKGATFGARIYSHIAPCGEADPWHVVIDSKSDTKIALFAFKDVEDDYWAASLELFLMDAFGDQVKEFNKRRG